MGYGFLFFIMLSYQSSLVSGKLVVNSIYKVVTNTDIFSVLAIIFNYLLNFVV